MKMFDGSIRRAAPSSLLCVLTLLVAASCSSSPTPEGGSAAAGLSDVVLVEGLDLESTADQGQQALIRSLLDNAGRADGAAAVAVDYPQNDSIIPPDFAAPTFLWHDPSNDAGRWLVDVAFDNGAAHLYVLVPGMPPPQGEIDPQCISVTNEIYELTPYQASAIAWKPGDALWSAIKTGSAGSSATLTFIGYDEDSPDRVLARGEVRLTTSDDPVGAPIFYRDVPLMPSATKEGVIKPLDQSSQPLIAWRLRDVGRHDTRLLLKDMPTCANCHSFSLDGSTFGMDVDGPDGDKGAYALASVGKDVVIDDDQVITWNAFEGKPEGHHTFGFLSRISPDGSYVVSTVNEALYVHNFWDHKFIQVFYPTAGILAWYSKATGEIKSLPGADDPNFVHCDAVWTPDGKTLIFARAAAREPYERGKPQAEYAGDPNETPMLYDLYSISFDEGRGGVAKPIPGASENGVSNSFPKVSPDGKWLVWVKSKNGQLMRPDGRLWIAPVEGGEAREMRSNTDLMNSWHSFSPNSRWMVFSSKVNRPYTQMFLTHIDENGESSPPLLIENATAANRAVNIPEFVNVAYDDFQQITVPAVNHYEFFARGNEFARTGRHAEAIVEFEQALAGEKREWRIQDWRIHDSLSKSLMQVGRLDEAMEHINESLAINEYNPEMHTNLGFILAQRGDFDGALEHMSFAIRIFPQDPKVWYNRGSLNVQRGDMGGAVDDYSEAIRLYPDYGEALSGRGLVLFVAGEMDAARADLDRAVELIPDDPAPWFFRAQIRHTEGDLAGAASDLARALEVVPAGSRQKADIEALYRQIRAELGTM